MKKLNSDETQLGNDEDETITKTKVHKVENKFDTKVLLENEKVDSQGEENNKLVTPIDKQTTANTETVKVNCHSLNENAYDDHEVDYYKTQNDELNMQMNTLKKTLSKR